MKITGLTGALNYPQVVREKQDGQSSQQQQHSPKQDKNSQDKSDQDPASEEDIDSAIAGFLSDAQAQAHGLSASVIGQGPGLKVILKDGTGGVVRQLTGEEFLRLRQAASLGSTSPKGSGKILDQKS